MLCRKPRLEQQISDCPRKRYVERTVLMHVLDFRVPQSELLPAESMRVHGYFGPRGNVVQKLFHLSMRVLLTFMSDDL